MIGKVQDVMSAAIVVGAATGSNSAGTSTGDAQTLVQNNAQQASVPAPQAAEGTNEAINASAAERQQKVAEKKAEQEKPMDEEAVTLMTQELNELMSKINCNLQFKYNKEVDMMTVKMIDKQTKEVLKEFPPEEMIKNMIKAKDWLGAFLDKNA
ncbi:MAG: flagellar protein FlaG [Schwartzia succinivorans]|jgi:flagellar protein FlaG|uniref:flagellar protein FlaG n=1 Tax=Schwartzia succinivorans TaxID=55507 RepID=UPI0023525E57|nr:flagellar protein FlaG [Schwartzia succinivorans]MBE6096700.1 flagellar protein FlaG [Schwartzia succinivorans]